MEQKNKPSYKLWLTIGAIVLVVILAVMLILSNRGERKDKDWATVIPGETQPSQSGEVLDDTRPEDPEQTAGSKDPANDTDKGTEPSESKTGETQAQNNDPIPTLGDEDPYEDWLASAMVIGISMQYTDFEFVGIYTASETPVAAHSSSAGAYVIFKADGQELALRSVPLSAERSDRGTADLYVPAIGYATYELVDAATVPVSSLKERKLEDLEALIVASSQVSIIER